jgi:hypothetical protein
MVKQQKDKDTATVFTKFKTLTSDSY